MADFSGWGGWNWGNWGGLNTATAPTTPTTNTTPITNTTPTTGLSALQPTTPLPAIDSTVSDTFAPFPPQNPATSPRQDLTNVGTGYGTLANTNTANSYTNLINQIYQAELGRAPDAGGLQYYQNLANQGTSLQETAKNKVIMENRITGLFKLLVPEEQGFDMSTITYEMIEELFPFPVQLQIMEEINAVISPNYKESKGK